MLILNQLETHLTNHCNLNCRACTHFCPLIKDEQFEDHEKYQCNIIELSKKIFFKKIKLLGGEPLLSPYVKSFITSTRAAYPKSDISITTNGILLPTQSKSFFDLLKEYNISIELSMYPHVEKHLNVYKELLTRYNIKYKIWPKLQFYKILKLKACDREKMFSLCKFKNCNYLFRNKIYKCAVGASMPIFNKTFKTSIPIDEGLDIIDNTPEDINQYLQRSTPTCSFCNWENPEIINWAKSSDSINDWIIQDD